MKSPEEICGLILTGGRSSRMGKPKSEIIYHAVSQQEYLTKLLSKYCDRVFISVKTSSGNPNEITDQFAIQSPLNGIASAIVQNPEKTWVVVGCDLPEIDETILDHLMKHRDPAYQYNGYLDSDNSKPEPMIGIWEGGLKDQILEYLDAGGFSPRELIMQLNAQLLQIPDPRYLTNINTTEQLQQYLRGRKD